MSGQEIYLKLEQITEVQKREVYLKDVARIYCRDEKLLNRARALKVMSIRAPRRHRYVMSSLEVIRRLKELDPSLQVNSLGEADFIIAYKPPGPSRPLWEWAKTLFVCAVCFCGAAFAIMTFNNDVSAADVFREVYRLVMGREAEGPTILEWAYCLGLAIGILVFFNHFAAVKLNTDPTPLEVEMRLYEDDISKTLIAQSAGKEKGPDGT